jgi:hypothetical protein
MSREFCHERIAEFADFIIALALGVEIGATLSAAHVQPCEGILKCLFKAEEFEDGEVNGGM